MLFISLFNFCAWSFAAPSTGNVIIIILSYKIKFKSSQISFKQILNNWISLIFSIDASPEIATGKNCVEDLCSAQTHYLIRLLYFCVFCPIGSLQISATRRYSTRFVSWVHCVAFDEKVSYGTVLAIDWCDPSYFMLSKTVSRSFGLSVEGAVGCIN